jgi:hypothetical protein
MEGRALSRMKKQVRQEAYVLPLARSPMFYPEY